MIHPPYLWRWMVSHRRPFWQIDGPRRGSHHVNQESPSIFQPTNCFHQNVLPYFSSQTNQKGQPRSLGPSGSMRRRSRRPRSKSKPPCGARCGPLFSRGKPIKNVENKHVGGRHPFGNVGDLGPRKHGMNRTNHPRQLVQDVFSIRPAETGCEAKVGAATFK